VKAGRRIHSVWAMDELLRGTAVKTSRIG
jgi:hypothetical protein